MAGLAENQREALLALSQAVKNDAGIHPIKVDKSCQHIWRTHTQRQYWLQCGEGIGPGYAAHAEHHTEHKVTKVYCQHCLEVREI